MTSTKATDKRRILVTGAAGAIGGEFAAYASNRYDLRLMARETDTDIERLGPHGELVIGDLADLALLTDYCRDIDTVIHLAASSSVRSTWEEVLHNNIIGTYHLFTAARNAGCRRVVFASSIHAVGAYAAHRQIRTTDAVRPTNLYGVSKCFGEALSCYIGEHTNLSVIAARFGWVQPLTATEKPENLIMLDTYVSYRDLCQLLVRCVEVEDVRFALVHGLGKNCFQRLEMEDTINLLGYAPEDDFADLHPGTRDLQMGKRVGARRGHA